uniref:G protein-coupled receptor n=1 Tax=Steinernema glaseri TaxID=37863 RepID=A0A1I8AIN6_9BILA
MATSDVLFNRALDISALLHVPLKLLSMYIVLRHSPKYMDSLPLFILNIMFWNLMANIVAAFLHINPRFPQQCHRADGPIGLLTSNEYIYHVFYAALFSCVLNCSLGLSYTFPYRYLLFVRPELVKRINVKSGICICLAVHFSVSTLFAYLYTYYIRSAAEYYLEAGIERPEGSIFCFWLSGWRKNTYMIGYFVVIFLAFGTVTLFAFLLGRHLTAMQNMLCKQTLALHRRFLRYLLINTAVPLTFGGIPFLIVLFFAIFPQIHYSREVTMVCSVILYNHGAVYSVVSIVTFKPYSKAVRRIARSICGLDGYKVKVLRPGMNNRMVT